MVKVTHLTSAHPRYDTRIFSKMCSSLAKEYEVNLVVADGKGDEIRNNVTIIDVGAKTGGRLSRMTKSVTKVYKKAKELDSDIYHLHDPELIPIGVKLKKLGKKVIFDAHEDVPKQILAKHYLNSFSKKILSFIYAKYEIYALKKFDFVITATPIIKENFLQAGIKSKDINNFPTVDDFLKLSPQFEENTFCYVGTLYKTRGIEEIVKAIEEVDAKLIIAGKFYDEEYEKYIKSLKGWKKVDFRGFVDKDEILKILENSLAGLVTLYPTPSYVEAYPVKMFEYMASGIGVISSNFSLYKELLGDSGIVVDPLNIDEISKAMQFCIDNKEKTREFGKIGRKLVKDKYNWENEEKKLFDIYKCDCQL
ncbi:Unknown, probable lipopolysaccharide biosynthesis protein [hydrothermal vent metagenome]|uniref:Glycosyltransferase n=1 Tax=hydrothermal vent metagenome TaxID=652676 RepID=A0A1W1CK40_9ZZZZ